MLRFEYLAQLTALNTFMTSVAFLLVQANFHQDVADHETSILSLSPMTQQDVAQLNQLYGKREVAIGMTTHFEELRNRLESQIAQMDESGNIVAQTTNEE